MASSGFHKFQLLTYTYFDGWVSFAYNEDDVSVAFNSVEDALADLQEAFSEWFRQVTDGERDRDDVWSLDEFAIRSESTGEIAQVALDGELVRLSVDGVVLRDKAILRRISSTGLLRLN